jgi:hypothetical protein
MGDGTAVSKTGADLLGNRRFESISLPAASQEPGDGEVDTALSYALCLSERVIGVGWQVDKDGPLPLETYMELGADAYEDQWWKGKSAVCLLAEMADGDLVWMRSPQGVYHLGKVKGPWEYRTALEVSERIWTRLTGGTVSPLSDDIDIFSLLSAKDCEDLISVYLQMQGWVVYPAQRRADTLAYEFVLRHRSDHREAVVQVKTGWSAVDLGTLPPSVDVAFAFQPNGQYTGKNPRALIIKREDVLGFVAANPRLVPDAVLAWSSS